VFLRKVLKVRIADKVAELDTLFDTGLSLTLIGMHVIEGKFRGVEVKPLRYPRKTFTLNGTALTVDSYVDGEVEVDGCVLEERIYVSKDFVEGVAFNGKLVRFPELVIGVSTMEAWGIELDLKRGEVTVRGWACSSERRASMEV